MKTFFHDQLGTRVKRKQMNNRAVSLFLALFMVLSLMITVPMPVINAATTGNVSTSNITAFDSSRTMYFTNGGVSDGESSLSLAGLPYLSWIEGEVVNAYYTDLPANFTGGQYTTEVGPVTQHAVTRGNDAQLEFIMMLSFRENIPSNTINMGAISAIYKGNTIPPLYANYGLNMNDVFVDSLMAEGMSSHKFGVLQSDLVVGIQAAIWYYTLGLEFDTTSSNNSANSIIVYNQFKNAAQAWADSHQQTSIDINFSLSAGNMAKITKVGNDTFYGPFTVTADLRLPTGSVSRSISKILLELNSTAKNAGVELYKGTDSNPGTAPLDSDTKFESSDFAYQLTNGNVKSGIFYYKLPADFTEFDSLSVKASAYSIPGITQGDYENMTFIARTGSGPKEPMLTVACSCQIYKYAEKELNTKEIQFTGTKTLANTNASLTDNMFTYSVYQIDASTFNSASSTISGLMSSFPNNKRGIGEMNALGQIAFSPAIFSSVENAGSYYYAIFEDPDTTLTSAGWTLDDTIYYVEVTLSKLGGVLSLTVDRIKTSGATGFTENGIDFVNTPPETSTTYPVTIPVTKTIEGIGASGKIPSGGFTMTITQTDASGNPSSSPNAATLPAPLTFTNFSPDVDSLTQSFNVTGLQASQTYYFMITETATADSSWAYDTYRIVKVEVAANGDATVTDVTGVPASSSSPKVTVPKSSKALLSELGSVGTELDQFKTGTHSYIDYASSGSESVQVPAFNEFQIGNNKVPFICADIEVAGPPEFGDVSGFNYRLNSIIGNGGKVESYIAHALSNPQYNNISNDQFNVLFGIEVEAPYLWQNYASISDGKSGRVYIIDNYIPQTATPYVDQYRYLLMQAAVWVNESDEYTPFSDFVAILSRIFDSPFTSTTYDMAGLKKVFVEPITKLVALKTSGAKPIVVKTTPTIDSTVTKLEITLNSNITTDGMFKFTYGGSGSDGVYTNEDCTSKINSNTPTKLTPSGSVYTVYVKGNISVEIEAVNSVYLVEYDGAFIAGYVDDNRVGDRYGIGSNVPNNLLPEEDDEVFTAVQDLIAGRAVFDTPKATFGIMETPKAEFINRYTPPAPVEPKEISIPLKKIVTGSYTGNLPTEFTMNIKQVDGPSSDKHEGTYQATYPKSITFTASELSSGSFEKSFKASGLMPDQTYYFKITEVNDAGIGWLYDTTYKVVEVRVTEAGAEIGTVTNGTDNKAVFTNNYTPQTPGSVTIPVTKTIAGTGSKANFPSGGFTITIDKTNAAGDQTVMNDIVISPASISLVTGDFTVDGASTTGKSFALSNLTEGVYYFKITESGSGANWTVDSRAYLVQINVSDTNVASDPIITILGGDTASSVAFTNTYQEPDPIAIPVTKVIADETGVAVIPDAGFTMEITRVDANGDAINQSPVVIKVGSTEATTLTFEDIDDDDVLEDSELSFNISGLVNGGTYYFKIVEKDVANAPKYWTYDGTEYIVKIVVTNYVAAITDVFVDGESTEEPETGVVFTNTYVPKYDAALIKWVSNVKDGRTAVNTPYPAPTENVATATLPKAKYKDLVTFSIKVINQGDLPIKITQIVDYIPNGYSFSAADQTDITKGTWALVGGILVYTPTTPISLATENANATVDLVLRVAGTDKVDFDYDNYAEISKMTDKLDNEVGDIDSTPDDTNGEKDTFDVDTMDNHTDGKRSDEYPDEDDHDIASIDFYNPYDAALKKWVHSVGNNAPLTEPYANTVLPKIYVSEGDIVTFAIKVINQGTANIIITDIVDYMPNGYEFVAADNAGVWATTGNSLLRYIGTGIALDGSPDNEEDDSAIIYLKLRVAERTAGVVYDYDNLAEIAGMTDDDNETVIDVDSTPNEDYTDDTLKDNEVDENGKLNEEDDEDDHDIAYVSYNPYDAALVKWVAQVGNNREIPAPATEDPIPPVEVKQHDIVKFGIKLINQGEEPLLITEVVDYMPNGYNFDPAMNPGWEVGTVDANGVTTLIYTPSANDRIQLAPGESKIIYLKLTVNAVGDEDYDNYAEISAIAPTEEGKYYPTITDRDSTPDRDNNEKDDCKDNVVSEKAKQRPDTDDEDDHDVARIKFINPYDAALKKWVYQVGKRASIDEPRNGVPTPAVSVKPGDKVIFAIKLINQGTEDIKVTEVVDYMPDGYTFDLADNAGWVLGEEVNGVTKLIYKPDAPISLPTYNPTRTIYLTLTVLVTGTHDNLAEIVEITNPEGLPVVDIDSTGDDNPNDDTLKDNEVDENGKESKDNDEDDHDIAYVEMNPYDAALKKWVHQVENRTALVEPNDGEASEPVLVKPGDKVKFAIKVINQGDAALNITKISDYMPDGYTFNAADNAGWTSSVNGGATTLTYKPSAPIALDIGESEIIYLTLTVLATGDYDNYAEISEMTGSEGEEIEDRDSTTDDDNTNDTLKDNEVNEDAKNHPRDDEDDHDIAKVTLNPYDAALRKWVYQVNSDSVIDEPANGIETPPVLVKPGDNVKFGIRVINQGEAAVKISKISDYMPDGYTFDPAINPDWQIIDETNGVTTLQYTPSANSPILLENKGDSEVVYLTLTVLATGTHDNYAEISEMTDTEDKVVEDRDSDTDSINDDELKDNEWDEDGKNNPGDDEDDHDVAKVTMNPYDAALKKWVHQVGTRPPMAEPDDGERTPPVVVNLGDKIKFAIKVINQGEATLRIAEVVDYMPNGYNFYENDQDDTNGTWSAPAGTGAKTIRYTPSEPLELAPGETEIIYITLTVLGTGTHDNFAEISKITDPEDNEVEDRDSTSDDDNSDDCKDNEVDEDAKNNPGDDEDDHDVAEVILNPYDAALRKWVYQVGNQAPISEPANGVPTPPVLVNVGDEVTFAIRVINQGDATLRITRVSDYMPSGYTFSAANNPGWTSASGTGARTLTYVPSTPIELDPGESEVIYLTLTVLATGTHDNFAEISEITDPDDNVVEDRDSTSDNSNNDTYEDNEWNEDGKNNPGEDEDDHDIAEVELIPPPVNPPVNPPINPPINPPVNPPVTPPVTPPTPVIPPPPVTPTPTPTPTPAPTPTIPLPTPATPTTIVRTPTQTPDFSADSWDPLFDLFGPEGPAGLLKFEKEEIPEVAKTNDSFALISSLIVLSISAIGVFVFAKGKKRVRKTTR